MKQILTLLFFGIVLYNCKSNKGQGSAIGNKSTLPTGTWYYQAYIDSTILNKRIYKYSWSCASMAYEITIDSKIPDSCYFKGYHEEWMIKLKKVSDNVYWAGDSLQHWILTFNNDNSTMAMKEYYVKSLEENLDPRTYLFQKRNEEIKDIKKYFIKNILSGVYKDSIREITLTDNNKIRGLDSASTFDIELDFWEMVPQMDLIYFKDNNDKTTRYNWTFIDNKLILKAVHDIYKNEDWDGGVADSIVYKLEKIK